MGMHHQSGWGLRSEQEPRDEVHILGKNSEPFWPFLDGLSEIVFYGLTVVVSYSLYHLFANTQAGARFADKTRQASAFEQLRTQRTHIIVYAGDYFDIFETLSFVQMVL
jgi:hypothetical protein